MLIELFLYFKCTWSLFRTLFIYFYNHWYCRRFWISLSLNKCNKKWIMNKCCVITDQWVSWCVQVHPGSHVSQRHHHHGGHQRQHEGTEDDHRQTHHQHHPGHAGRERLRQRHRSEKTHKHTQTCFNKQTQCYITTVVEESDFLFKEEFHW